MSPEVEAKISQMERRLRLLEARHRTTDIVEAAKSVQSTDLKRCIADMKNTARVKRKFY